mmetsp:Transcript_38882/g.90458  ORF Transcript_38882/g.90458 Transcript_38882/m.90458 type:complete len:183 (+) Transcript_38882:2271-2819(+)
MFHIGNAYLNAPTTEKIYVPKAGIEFGENAGKVLIITRALYRLKSPGAAYRSFFVQSLQDMGFKSCLSDADVWQRAAVKEDGTKYYECILTYVDGCLFISVDVKAITRQLKDEFEYVLKDEAPSTQYFGATTGKYQLDTETSAWFMSAELYLKKAIMKTEMKWGNLSKMFNGQHLDVPVMVG